MRIHLVLAAILTLSAGGAWAIDPLTGVWKTQSDETAMIAPCGADYCITAKTGKYAGQKIGSVRGTDSTYNGKLTDPRNGTTYSGKLTISGDTLTLKGCVTSVLCQTQTWARQK